MEVPGFNEAGDPMDQHRDMRLDIDHMSYEVSLLVALCDKLQLLWVLILQLDMLCNPQWINLRCSKKHTEILEFHSRSCLHWGNRLAV